MGGIFLILALIGVYIVVFWAIHIELKSDKTTGLLGLIPQASETLHGQLKKAKSFGLNQTNFDELDTRENRSVFMKSNSEKKKFIVSDNSFIAKFKNKLSQSKSTSHNVQDMPKKKPFLKK